jgi:choline dehydrogenase-like flavoprotein
VRGLACLRVVDASIMPTVPRGDTNVPPPITIAEGIAVAIAVAIADEARAAA